jgi:pilus assembly protein CpaE
MALRDGLSETLTEPMELRRGGIRAAIAALQRSATPRVLIVDVSGEEQPLMGLGQLADVSEPDVLVLAIGELAELDFYRAVTRRLGVREYLVKPVTRDQIGLHFAPLISGQGLAEPGMLGGHAVTVTGARGGVGASTIALNLAWHYGVIGHRHTVLLDPDLQMGVAAFLLDLRPGPGLRAAFEAPERIDTLLAERAALPVAERLHVLAGNEDLVTMPPCASGTAAHLLNALRRRYSFVVADVPFRPLPLHHELLELGNQRVLVMEPTLASVRDVLRLLALPTGPAQPRQAVVVLNRAGSTGGMTLRDIEHALGRRIDVAIPNLPRQVSNAANLGEPAITHHGGFRAAIADLARQAAPVRMLDAAATRPDEAPDRRSWLRRLARRSR